MSVIPIESASIPPPRPSETDERAQAQVAPHREPVLITEQEVLLGSAAAVGLRAEPAPGWLGAFRRIFAHSEVAHSEKRPSYPSRCTYLENARMSREMWRL